MSENNKRMLIAEDDLEKITGGNIQFVATSEEAYMYGSHNPDKKYGFSASIRKISKFVSEHYDYYGEAGIFDAMKAEGLIYDLPETP